MAIAPTLEKYLAAKNVKCDVIAKAILLPPKTKREADVVAFTLFCLFSFILVGFITAGIL
jgi:hypothetical protein